MIREIARLLELKPGITVRRRFGAGSGYHPFVSRRSSAPRLCSRRGVTRDYLVEPQANLPARCQTSNSPPGETHYPRLPASSLMLQSSCTCITYRPTLCRPLQSCARLEPSARSACRPRPPTRSMVAIELLRSNCPPSAIARSPRINLHSMADPGICSMFFLLRLNNQPKVSRDIVACVDRAGTRLITAPTSYCR